MKEPTYLESATLLEDLDVPEGARAMVQSLGSRRRTENAGRRRNECLRTGNPHAGQAGVLGSLELDQFHISGTNLRLTPAVNGTMQ